MTQKEMILEALKEGRALTSLEALKEFGCFRLTSRIWDLKQDGHEIDVRTINRNGKHYSEYKLVPPVQPSLFGGRL